MNKILNIYNLTLFILFSSLFIFILLSLFFHVFYFESFFYYNIHHDSYTNIISDYFRIDENLSSRSLNEDEILHTERPSTPSCSCSCSCSSSSSSSSQDIHCFTFVDKVTKGPKKIYINIKNNINKGTNYATHKIKVIDRTLS